MPYSPPPLTNSVVLIGGYTPPPITDPIVLGAPDDSVDVTLSATLPALALPTPTFAAAVETIQPVTLSATLPALSIPTPSFSAIVDSPYSPPPLTNSVVLIGGYTPPPITDPIVLGAPDSSGSVDVTLSATLPALSIPTPTFAATVEIDLALPDADGTRLRIESQPAAKTATGLAMAQQQMQPARRGVGIAEQSAAPIQVGAELLAAHGLRVRQGVGLPQAQGFPADAGARVPHADTIRTRTRLTMGQQAALPTALRLAIGHHQAQVTANRLSIRWQQAKWPDPGRWWPRYVVPPLTDPVVLIPGYTPRPLRCPIVLSWNNVAQPPCGGGETPQPGIVVPVREVYVVLNTFSLVRADTSEPVLALDFDAAIDADSWTWTWSANVPGSQLSLVKSPALGEFVELIATLNGTPLRCVVENLGRSRQFGKSALKIGGRGRAAWLADPTSPTITAMNTESRTARQLLDAALMDNGVPLGWTVDWQLEDWLVPAAAWSYTGTYIGAATRIAEAGGGYVQADKSAEILHILPYYPIAPWDWAAATPDIVLPEDVCTTEDIEWSDKAAYNAVWIVGGAGGRREHIKRAASAADRHAPTVVDPLATDPIMTRQRGLRVLADTGRQALIGIKLPVLEETGIILPGSLIQYNEQGQTHIGLSRSVALHWGFPKCRQTVRIETHELESV